MQDELVFELIQATLLFVGSLDACLLLDLRIGPLQCLVSGPQVMLRLVQKMVLADRLLDDQNLPYYQQSHENDCPKSYTQISNMTTAGTRSKGIEARHSAGSEPLLSLVFGEETGAGTEAMESLAVAICCCRA